MGKTKDLADKFSLLEFQIKELKLNHHTFEVFMSKDIAVMKTTLENINELLTSTNLQKIKADIGWLKILVPIAIIIGILSKQLLGI